MQAVAITVREKSGDVAGLVVAVSEVADTATIRISVEQLRRCFTAVTAERRRVGRVRSGIDMSGALSTLGVGFARVVYPKSMTVALAAVVPVSSYCCRMTTAVAGNCTALVAIRIGRVVTIGCTRSTLGLFEAGGTVIAFLTSDGIIDVGKRTCT